MQQASAEAEESILLSLGSTEVWWRDHYDWLLGLGFKLRPRYRPGWVASWKGTGKPAILFEDFPSLSHTIIDAEYEGRVVVLKKTSKETHPDELRVAKLFGTTPLILDPRNHCVPILRILEVPENPDDQILVMPLLRGALDPPFRTVGEAMQCIGEIFEGIQFMHEHNVAHRDCTWLNLMLDPASMYPDGFHFIARRYDLAYKKRAVHYPRTERQTKYYIIDFGLSQIMTSEAPKAYRNYGGDRTAPEFENQPDDMLYDPFPTDVYYLGNWIRVHMMEGEPPGPYRRSWWGMYGLEFLRPLVQDMVQDDPTKRPKMDEVVSRFRQIEVGLSSWRLRSRVIDKKTYNPLTSWFYTIKHWVWTLKLIFRRVPAIPPPLASLAV